MVKTQISAAFKEVEQLEEQGRVREAREQADIKACAHDCGTVLQTISLPVILLGNQLFGHSWTKAYWQAGRQVS